MLIAPDTRKDINSIIVKELQVTLKTALKKIEALDFNKKLGIENFDEENIMRFRNIYFRLAHNDFFTHVRMKQYKMTKDDLWPRCGMVETSKHLIWECLHVRNIWNLFNNFMTQISNSHECVNKYGDIFQTCERPGTSIVKTKILQELGYSTFVTKLKNIEYHNACLSWTFDKCNSRWKHF